MLSVKRINVFYKDFQALWNVEMLVENGEAVALIGSNGAGKTTLLKTISGLLHSHDGEILLDTEKIHMLPPHEIAKRGIVQVPEGRLLFPRMTVLENLMMGAYVGEAWVKRWDTLDYIYNLFPILKQRSEQTADTLSGGEQQMLAIGRALMAKPKIMLIDELSLGLAPKIVDELFRVIKNVHNQGLTLLIAEQHVDRVLEICERGYVLETGKIVLQGSSKELIENKYIKRAFLGI
jgi:branched-chain amino acid transport system ATP-binding protein